jgi:hypothetical protein
MRKRKSKPQITHQQLAAQHFEPIPGFVNLNTNEERKEQHEGALQDISVVSRMAIHLLGLHKSEMIQNMKKKAAEDGHRTADEMLKMFVRGRERTEALLKLIECAEIRFASSMASVFREDGSVRGLVH